MTDFFHEQPKEEQPAAAPQTEEPELNEKTGQKRVYGYIFILFIVAFSLLVWAFLMNQRGTDRVLSELRGNADALQTTLSRNVELEREADALKERVEALEKEKEALEQSVAAKESVRETLERDVSALRVEQNICHALLLMDEGDYEGAAVTLTARYATAELLKQLDAAPDVDGEPSIDLRARYDAMVEELVERGYLTVAEDGQLKSWHVDASD